MFQKVVIPAKAGTHQPASRALDQWVPAFAGMTPNGWVRPGALLAITLLTFLIANTAHAVRPDEMLADPQLEARARVVGQELRCLVCRNQSIDDSDADLAHDLRVLVRQRIAAGDSNERVIAYIRSRYGDFVLLRPPLEIGTALLWGGPTLLLLLGGLALVRFYRRPDAAPAAPLSSAERQQLAAMLGKSGEP
jgi:cytochrome c-type biogenesis protein CcmH